MGGQSRPSRDRAQVASQRQGAEVRSLQAGQGAEHAVCSESHPKAREGGQRRSVLRAPRLPWGCHPPLPVSLPIVQHQEQTHHPGLSRCPGQFCASPCHPKGHLVKKILKENYCLVTAEVKQSKGDKFTASLLSVGPSCELEIAVWRVFLSPLCITWLG